MLQSSASVPDGIIGMAEIQMSPQRDGFGNFAGSIWSPSPTSPGQCHLNPFIFFFVAPKRGSSPDFLLEQACLLHTRIRSKLRLLQHMPMGQLRRSII